MAGNFVALGDDGLNRVRVTLGDRAAGEKCRLDALLLQDAQDAPDRRVRPVFALRVFLVIARAVGSGRTSSPPWKSNVSVTATRESLGQ